MDPLTVSKMSLAEIGTRSTITSLTDGSEEALYCNLYYTSVRDQALSAARWDFARRIDSLMAPYKSAPGTPENPTASATGWQRTYPPPPWLYSYTLPSDFLYAWSIIGQPPVSGISPPLYPIANRSVSQPRAPRVPFEMVIDHYDQSGNPFIPPVSDAFVVTTNAQTPLLEYTYRNFNENLYSSQFVMVLVKALAAYLAIALTADKQIAQIKFSEANNLIMQARAMNANEGLTVLDHIPDWLTIRGVGGSYMSSDYYYPYGPLFSLPF